ncbi:MULTISPECIES: hypothetical protein [unclassified Wolbachia]|uniref:hypothetical protein n=1 Tax=unclassified Wolbachia TaxID=2640676 RepID=UPI00222EA1AE|nr:hypothetical protein [Wolbachia endosymbiont (group A) of Apoderus coryli]
MLEAQEDKLKRGIARLIDNYAQEYINQEEFEPRIRAMKQNLKMVEEQKKKIFDQKKLTEEFTLIVTNLEGFSSSINSSLDNADWLTKRDIIRTLVKRIEINFENVNIVFRVKELPDSSHREKDQYLQCCCRGRYDGSRRHSNSSSRYLLAGSRDTANESRYDGSRWHDDNLVIPLRVSAAAA